MGAVVAVDDIFASPVVGVLVELERAGAQFKLADGQILFRRHRGILTPEHRKVLSDHGAAAHLLVLVATDAGVHARRDAFRRRLDDADPFTLPGNLFVPNVPYQAGACFSCGDPLPEPRFGRCVRCSLGWWLACHAPITAALAAEIAIHAHAPRGQGC